MVARCATVLARPFPHLFRKYPEKNGSKSPHHLASPGQVTLPKKLRLCHSQRCARVVLPFFLIRYRYFRHLGRMKSLPLLALFFFQNRETATATLSDRKEKIIASYDLRTGLDRYAWLAWHLL